MSTQTLLNTVNDIQQIFQIPSVAPQHQTDVQLKNMHEVFTHSYRVAAHAGKLAELMNQSEQDVETITVAAYLHDIGKVFLPDHIISKNSALETYETMLMRQHCVTGHSLLSHMEKHTAAIIALQHHEHWDGSGYPYGISGNRIHLFSRITAVCDVFDALYSKRSYKPAWQIDQIIQYFNEFKGMYYDPMVTTIFLNHIESFIDLPQTELSATA